MKEVSGRGFARILKKMAGNSPESAVTLFRLFLAWKAPPPQAAGPAPVTHFPARFGLIDREYPAFLGHVLQLAAEGRVTPVFILDTRDECTPFIRPVVAPIYLRNGQQ
jgi:hypothetical protein